MSTVGFLGLGRMGQAMAPRLLEAGFDLTVWNRSSAATDSLRDGLFALLNLLPPVRRYFRSMRHMPKPM